MKFKIGDNVRLSEGVHEMYPSRQGRVARIVGVGRHFFPADDPNHVRWWDILWDDGIASICFHEDGLEKIA